MSKMKVAASKIIKAAKSKPTLPKSQNLGAQAAAKKAKPSAKSAGKPSKLKAPTPTEKAPNVKMPNSGKKSLGEYADEILSKNKLRELPEGMPASPAESASRSMGGRALKVAAEEGATGTETAALKRIGKGTAGKIAKTFGKVAGAGAIGGAVGIGLNALAEGLDAEVANPPEQEKKDIAEYEAKMSKSDKKLKKGFEGQMQKHFSQDYKDVPVKKTGVRKSFKVEDDGY